MKKIIFSILVLFLLVPITACQKTPDSPIVISKNMESIVDKAVENPIVVDADSGEDLKKPLEAPGKFTLKTEGVKGNLKVSVDADIVVPNTESMPIARVSRGEFSEEDVKKLYEVFCGDSKNIVPNSPLPSSYYLDQVQELQKRKAAGEYDDKLKEENIDDVINDLLKQAAEAPETQEYKEIEPDFSFKENKDEATESNIHGLGLYAHLKFMPDDNTVSEIIVYKESPYSSAIYAEYYRDMARYDEINGLDVYSHKFENVEPDILPTMTMEEAQGIAKDTISSLGLDDFVCGGSRVTPNNSNEYYEEGQPEVEIEGLYEFMFTRKINNVPINFTDDEGLTTIHDAYHEPWMYERIRMFIDDDGIFYMKWASPYEVKEIVSEASSMLPFSDIADIFERMAPMKYDYWDSDDRYSYEMKVTEARLGLMRVTEKDVGDSGLIIPVWDFFGTLAIKGKSGVPNMVDGEESYTYESFLTINAIDGSIIDRDLGY